MPSDAMHVASLVVCLGAFMWKRRVFREESLSVEIGWEVVRYVLPLAQHCRGLYSVQSAFQKHAKKLHPASQGPSRSDSDAE